jgi:hypothetical protein
MGGNTSLRVYHSFGTCVSSYLFALSLEQYLWFICYYGVYETMFCVLVEHYACSTMYYLFLMSSWYMCEMAMEFDFSSLSSSEFHID